MFAGVYVAKEAVEHLLLSAGGGTHGHGHGGGGAVRVAGDGHHHHWGDEKPETLGCVIDQDSLYQSGLTQHSVFASLSCSSV